jgi:hypothetical protein
MNPAKIPENMFKNSTNHIIEKKYIDIIIILSIIILVIILIILLCWWNDKLRKFSIEKLRNFFEYLLSKFNALFNININIPVQPNLVIQMENRININRAERPKSAMATINMQKSIQVCPVKNCDYVLYLSTASNNNNNRNKRDNINHIRSHLEENDARCSRCVYFAEDEDGINEHKISSHTNPGDDF